MFIPKKTFYSTKKDFESIRYRKNFRADEKHQSNQFNDQALHINQATLGLKY